MTGGLSDALLIPRRRGRPPKHTYMQPTSSTRGSPATVSFVPQHRSTNSLFPSRSGDATPKTVVKGNIMYKTTETGEVIASVVKNGPQSADTAAAAAAAVMGNQFIRKSLIS